MRAIEWEIRHPLSAQLIAIVRLLELGPRREQYFRAVTGDRDAAQRRLLGYWASLDEARRAVLALEERSSGLSIGGVTDSAQMLPLLPWKPAPAPARSGLAARPAKHGKSAGL